MRLSVDKTDRLRKETGWAGPRPPDYLLKN